MSEVSAQCVECERVVVKERDAIRVFVGFSGLSEIVAVHIDCLEAYLNQRYPNRRRS
jgi:hypothetical protein